MRLLFAIEDDLLKEPERGGYHSGHARREKGENR
jgi:hypothetical protein